MISIRGQYKKIFGPWKKHNISVNKNSYLQQGHCRSAELPYGSNPRDRGCPVSLWGEPFREWGDNDWKEKMSRKSCCPQHGTVKEYRAGGCACRSLRRWWGSRGFVSSAALQPMLNRIPSLCPGLPPCYAESVSLGYANLGVIQPGRIWDSPGKIWSHLSSKGPRLQNKVLLLAEGSEALRVWAGESQSCEAGRKMSHKPKSELSLSLGAFTPQCPRSHQWVSNGQTRERKTGMAQGFYLFDCRPVSPWKDGCRGPAAADPGYSKERRRRRGSGNNCLIKR